MRKLYELPRQLYEEIHSVSEYKKRYIRNYTQFFVKFKKRTSVFFGGLRNQFVNVQGNKKRQ